MKELRTAVPFFMQADSLCTALFPKDQNIPVHRSSEVLPGTGRVGQDRIKIYYERL